MDNTADVIPADRMPKPLPLCPRCGYDLGPGFSSTPPRPTHCPECGAEWGADAVRLVPWPSRLRVVWLLTAPCGLTSLSFPCWVWFAVGLGEAQVVLMVLVLLLIGGGVYWPAIMSSILAERHVPELERGGTGFKLFVVGVLLNVAVVTLGVLTTFAVVLFLFFNVNYP